MKKRTAKVLGAVRHAPHTTREIVQITGLRPASVYAACVRLRADRLVAGERVGPGRYQFRITDDGRRTADAR